MKTYKFLQKEPPEENVKQQTIVVSEEVFLEDANAKNDSERYVLSQTRKKRFTIAQLERDILDIEDQITGLQEQKLEKEGEITAVVKALNLKL